MSWWKSIKNSFIFSLDITLSRPSSMMKSLIRNYSTKSFLLFSNLSHIFWLVIHLICYHFHLKHWDIVFHTKYKALGLIKRQIVFQTYIIKFLKISLQVYYINYFDYIWIHLKRGKASIHQAYTFFMKILEVWTFRPNIKSMIFKFKKLTFSSLKLFY